VDIIRKVAVSCVARAVMFGVLGISCIMFSLAFDPPTAFRSGAILTLAMAGILLLKAQYVLRQKPRHTEAWIYLDERMRPRDDDASRRYVGVLRGVYADFARWTFFAACGLFAVSLLLHLAGLGYEGPIIRPR
jgi:hypothetical protein